MCDDGGDDNDGGDDGGAGSATERLSGSARWRIWRAERENYAAARVLIMGKLPVEEPNGSG
jgi:hypothetical protein